MLGWNALSFYEKVDKAVSAYGFAGEVRFLILFARVELCWSANCRLLRPR